MWKWAVSTEKVLRYAYYKPKHFALRFAVKPRGRAQLSWLLLQVFATCKRSAVGTVISARRSCLHTMYILMVGKMIMWTGVSFCSNDCLGIAIICSDDSSLPLCQSHYACVYRLSNQERVHQMSCKVCGTKRKHTSSTSSAQRFLPCPEPQRVETFLKETVDHDCSLSAGDLVCYFCYKYCRHILETNDCMLSSDEILNQLKQEEKQLE